MEVKLRPRRMVLALGKELMKKVNTDQGPANYDNDVAKCPRCHHAISPIMGSAFRDGKGNLDIAYKCTNTDCLRMFVGEYKNTNGSFYFQRAAPFTHKDPIISEEVQGVSPSFVKIYSQASKAESSALDEIAGVGYRKALEFLVKDFCIHSNPPKEEEIKKVFLGVVIDNYVDDANIKACAKRAAWLGNDETHYVRKWECKDIEDLKILIELTCGWVRNSVLTKKYLEEMA